MTSKIKIHKYSFIENNIDIKEKPDVVADESALQLFIIYTQNNKKCKFHLTTLMRSYGDDNNLIVGLLFSEGIICRASQIKLISPIGKVNKNLWKVELTEDCFFNPEQHKRNLLATASCGICSQVNHPEIKKNKNSSNVNITIPSQKILYIGQDFSKYQAIFKQTGGVHAVAVYDLFGNYIVSAEDIGRHNACDKVIGNLLKQNLIENTINYCMIFSSRMSYELIQKANQANVKIVLALGAPSKLAVDLAQRYNITLIGFLKTSSFNVYSGNERIG